MIVLCNYWSNQELMTNRITSKEAKSILKISDCKLMHLRESGILRVNKEGRRFMYNEDDVKKYRKLNSSVKK